jgi:hypothetical protein
MRYNRTVGKRVRKIFLLVFFVCVQEIHALDIEITEKEAEAHLRGEYNRNYYFFGDISAIGGIEVNNRLKFRTGLSIGWAQDITDIRIFSSARFSLLEKRPLGVELSWIYNGLPEYEAHSHTLLPCLSWNAKYWGIKIGPSLRFTSFFSESTIFETTLSIGAYANFVNNEKLRIGVNIANFNDFQAHTFGFFSVCFNSAMRINPCWSILNELELKLSGVDGLTTNFYGIALRGGAKFTW